MRCGVMNRPHDLGRITHMKFFLDTANVEEIRRIARLGLVDGLTTTPSLIAKEGRNFKEVIQEICTIVSGPVSAEVIGTTLI